MIIIFWINKNIQSRYEEKYKYILSLNMVQGTEDR